MIGLYDKENPDWEYENKFMGGWTEDFVRRKEDGHSEHSYLSQYKNLYEVTKKDDYKLGNILPDRIIFTYGRSLQEIEILEEIYECELPYLRYIRQYLVEHDGSDEFIYNAGRDIYEKIILEDFPKLRLETRKLSSDEVNDINKQRTQYIQETNKKKHGDDLHELLRIKEEERKKNIKRCPQSIKDEIKWFSREYQEKIINLGLTKLNELGKFYLELATGSGKTYIVFKIFEQLKPDVLFCLSPRLKINKQNIGNKYLSILGKGYEAFDLSSNEDLDTFMKKECKKVIIGCTSKGCDNIVDIIEKYNLLDTSLWIDEAHWGVEGWIKHGLSVKQDYLLKNTYIKHRVFTSASPNTETVENNESIFGELFKEITVKELIQLRYLCNIKPFIFEVYDDDVDYCKTIIKDFKDYNRKWGLSFHNKCLNAFHIFVKHYEAYKKGDTLIKPYLLIRDNIKETLSKEEDKRIFDNIDLDYGFTCFDNYESNMNSIAYVVKKCDMGYDFNKIDYISLTDKKMSYADLIQCIGRGLRSDGLGENGKNKDKELYLMIPNYIDEDNAENFDGIINVIQYLQYDIGLEWEDIKITKKNGESSGSHHSHEEYEGNKIIKSKILDAMVLRKVEWSLKKMIIYCKNNNIHNLSEYIAYKHKYPSLTLPDDIPSGFNWCDTYRRHNYYSKEECIEKIKQIMEIRTDLEYMEDHEELLEIVTNMDSKIPGNCLWEFYGGSQSDYLVFN